MPPRAKVESDPVQKQESGKPIVHEGVAASVSWIDSASPAGRMVSDPTPPDSISHGFISAASGFRFSNHVRALVTTSDNKTIDKVNYDKVKITKAPSALGIKSQDFFFF